MTTVVYRVRDWEKHFETADSKRLKSMRYFAIPNKHDGKGFRRVMALPNAGDVFSAWILILQVASKCPVRGVLADEDGPLDCEDLQFKTGLPAEAFQAALDTLCDPKIGWMEVSGNPQQSTEVSGNPQQSTENHAIESRVGESINNTPLTPHRGERVRREAFDPESVELPDPLDCDRFRDAWRKWVDHRREIRKRLTRKSVTEQLGKLAELGVDGAVSAIETAIANGWTGVVFPGSKSQPARASPADTGAAAAFEATRNVILKIPVQDTDRYRSAMASLDARARGALQAIGGARRIRDMTDQNRGLVFSQFRSAFEKAEP